MEINTLKRISWSNQLEDYFKKTGERAYGYGLLHKQCEKLYSFRTTIIDLPVIILSTICGTLSIGNASLFGAENEKLASMAIGGLSLCVGVINTIGSYFSWAKRAEAHKISSIEYTKLFRFLSIELSLPREERMNCKDLLKSVRESFERLQEIAPLIPQEVLNNFKKKYKNYSNISKPSEINGLECIIINNKKNITSKEDICEKNEKKTNSIISPSLFPDIQFETHINPPYIDTSLNTFTSSIKNQNDVVADIVKTTVDNVILDVVPKHSPSSP
jgi:hypothetical protein